MTADAVAAIALLDADTRAREPVAAMSDEQVSLHEAAHAVVMVVLCPRAPVVAVLLAPGLGGYVAHAPARLSAAEEHVFLAEPAWFMPEDVQTRRRALKGVTGGVLEALIVTASGPRMNARLGLNPRLANHDGAALELGVEAIVGRPSFTPMRGFDRESRRLRAWVDAQADHLIDVNEQWIARVAAELLTRRTLTKAEILTLKKERR